MKPSRIRKLLVLPAVVVAPIAPPPTNRVNEITP
jgi:hypothetical protein